MAPQPAQTGNHYDSTVLRDKASAHFGDVINHHHMQTSLPPRPTCIIPFRRDRDFIERNALNELYRRTFEPAARIGVVGLGGVGKTQIAIEYAYRRREADNSLWVFWVHASSAARFQESYRQIAQQANIPRWDDPTADILALVHGWLSDEQNGPWTMVLDNADSTEVLFTPKSGIGSTASSVQKCCPLSSYLPSAVHGSLVVTSRSRDVLQGLIEYAEDIIDVLPLSDNDGKSAVALLLARLRSTNRDVAADDLECLVKELDYMPLAITQAAAHINQRAPRITVSTFLNELRVSDLDRDRFLQKDVRDPRRDGESSNSIIKTWHISFEHIQRVRASAAHLLSLMSLFDHENIPQSLLEGNYLLQEANSGSSDEAASAQQNILDFEEDLTILRGYSLVRIGTDETSFDMHRLVQYSTRKWLEINNDLALWQGRYFQVLKTAFEQVSPDRWIKKHGLYRHIQAMLPYRVTDPVDVRNRMYLLVSISTCAMMSHREDIVVEMLRVGHKEALEIFGPSHPLTEDLAAKLAAASVSYDQDAEVNQLLGQAQEVLDAHSTMDTLTKHSLDRGLAYFLLEQGRTNEAERILRKMLYECEEEYGRSNLMTLISAVTLASILRNNDQPGDADEVRERSIMAAFEEHGSDHYYPHQVVLSWGKCAERGGDLAEALDLYRRALQGCEEFLEPSHSLTTRCHQSYTNLLKKTELETMTPEQQQIAPSIDSG